MSSLWISINGDIILTGKEYDGKGFGIKALWTENDCEVPKEDITKIAKKLHMSVEDVISDLDNYNNYYYILDNGKLTKSLKICTEDYKKLLSQVNIPTGSDGSFRVNILKSLIDDTLHIRLSGSIKDGYIDDISEWLKRFIKDRRSEGWNFCNSTIKYHFDTPYDDGTIKEFMLDIDSFGYTLIEYHTSLEAYSWESIDNILKS